MAFAEHHCVSVVCDTCGDGWEEGPWHFDSREEATNYLRDQWLVTDTLILCTQCSRNADCAATGHQWDAWAPRQRDGVTYLYRDCEHCQHPETDPPLRELSDAMHMARTINGLGAEDERSEPDV